MLLCLNIALIDFETQAGVDEALAMDGCTFGERWLKIKLSGDKPTARQTSKKEPGCHTVFVGNLSWDIDEDSLRAHFAECGEITSVRFAEDRETGAFKGFGHVEFVESDSTDKAVELAGTYLMDRAVRVDFANPRPARNSFGGGGRGRGGGRGGGGRGRGGRGGGRGGRGGRGGPPSAHNAKKNGAIAGFAGKKITFD